MSGQTIGTCSLCGGPVRVASPWMGINQPVPKCAHCHATKRGHGPVIEMERRGPSPGWAYVVDKARHDLRQRGFAVSP